MSQSSGSVGALPRSPGSPGARADAACHVAVDIKDVLRDFEPDVGQPLSEALTWDFIWPELSDRILSKDQYLQLHPGDASIVDGVWDAVVQVLVRRASTSFSDSDTLCGTGFLVRRPPPVFGSTRPLLPPLVLAPLHLVADSDPEQIMVRLNYTFGAKPNEVVLLRCRRVFYSNLIKRESGRIGADTDCIGFALLEVTVRQSDARVLFATKCLEIENNLQKEAFVMKNSGSARVITIGHRQGLPKSISVGYGVTVEQRGAKCWTVEYHSQSDPGSSGSLVLFGGNIEITGKSTRVNLGTMDYFIGLIHYGMYESGPVPTDLGIAFIPTPDMMRNLFIQLEEAYRFDFRDAAIALGLSVDKVNLSATGELHCPEESLETLMLHIEETYIDTTGHKHDRFYPVARSIKEAERWKNLYKAGSLLFIGLVILGLTFALLIAIFRVFNPHSRSHPPPGSPFAPPVNSSLPSM